MDESLIYIIMIVSMALSALCSVLEATLLSTPLSYITGLEDQGVKGAERLKKLKQNSDRPISAILCLNTIANTVGASIVGSLVYEVYGDALVGVFSTIFTFGILIFSEIIPKTIGSSYWRSLALPASAIISMMIFISFPLVWILEHLQRLISSNSNQVSVSREDISAMVSVATEEEVIEKDEKKMIQNLLKLDEVTAHEIMTPSVVVEMVPGSMSIKEFITRAKISTAENLLKFSDFSYLDISLAMGFSSQSAFISVFKKLNGITPKQYREKYYMLNISSESETDIDDTENI